MQPKETNEYSRSWYPITLAQSTHGLGKLVFGICVRKWLNDSPLWSTFLAKLERSEGEFVDIFDTKVF